MGQSSNKTIIKILASGDTPDVRDRTTHGPRGICLVSGQPKKKKVHGPLTNPSPVRELGPEIGKELVDGTVRSTPDPMNVAGPGLSQ